jgi:beta-glucanase (GH16 family)
MKLLFCLLIWLFSSQTAPPAADWKLVWADEFDTPGPPDPKKWRFENGFVRNNEHQWYQPDNARCENGFLVIESRRENRPNPNYQAGSTNWKTSRDSIHYTSSCLLTRGLHQWQFGRFEMRGRIDTRSGMWPAFWSLGVSGSWPSNGEVDIMEYYRGMLLANAAWGTDKKNVGAWSTTKKPITEFNDPKWSEKFHVWRMDWDKAFIKLYVDDQLLSTVDLKNHQWRRQRSEPVSPAAIPASESRDWRSERRRSVGDEIPGAV